MVSFACQVVKQEDLDLSAVLLYKNGNKPSCVGYSIGAEQIPTKLQVKHLDIYKSIFSFMMIYK